MDEFIKISHCISNVQSFYYVNKILFLYCNLEVQKCIFSKIISISLFHLILYTLLLLIQLTSPAFHNII